MTLNNNGKFSNAHSNVKTTLYNAALDRQNNYLGKKIAEARTEAGLTLTAFGKLLEDYGVSVGRSAMNKWELGETAPNAYQLLAIAQALHVEEDMSYFMSTSNCAREQLNREGMLKVASYRDDLIASGRYKPQAEEHTIIHFRDMPVSYLAASAGTGQFLDEGNFEMVSFPESHIPEGAEFGMRVSGDSMEPIYHDGQIVWVQQCERVGIGEVGIFIYDGEGYIKAYGEQEPDASEQDDFTDSCGVVHMQPVMISYNQKYQPRVISANANFKVVGRVL